MLQELAANVRELRAIDSVVPLSILKLLEVNDRAKLLAASDRYQVFKAGEIHDLWYQKKIVKDACRKTSGPYAYQLPPGAGKTFPSAEISARFQRHGKTIYVCPNTAAMGDDSSGIIQKFHRMYAKLGIKARIGRVNETTTLNDVHFFTPASLLGLKRLQKSLFDRIIKEAALLVVDEAHHFMDETDGRHKIFGQIPKLAFAYFEKKRKKVVAFTATYGRLDGKPLIVHTPDFKLTVQDVVNEGRCPEIHAIQIFLPFKCPKARDSKLDYDLGLRGKEYEDYWRMVAGVIIKTCESNPAPFAAFVRLKTEAAYLAEVFNHSSGMGDRGMAVLTSNTPMPERLRIIEKINTGKLAGYVTCGVGEEAIDIPKLEVIHFIKRTRSDIKLLQALGRGLRVAEGKQRTVFVDYQVMKESVIKACNGIVRLAKISDLDPAEVLKKTNGGPIISIKGSKTAIIPGAETFGETEALIVRQLQLERSSTERRKEAMIRYASTGAERPSENQKGDFEGEPFVQMGRLFYKLNNPKSKEYDPVFLKRLYAVPKVHASWKQLRKHLMEDREAILLERAASGQDIPSWKSEFALRMSLRRWTSQGIGAYKPEFDKKIRALAPRWFKPNRSHRENLELDLPNVGEQVQEFSKPLGDMLAPVPNGHWLKTGYYSNASRGYARASRGDVEEAILAALEKGELREPRNDSWKGDHPDDFFVMGETTQVRIVNERAKHYQVPLVWELSDLVDGLANYTDDNSTGAGRRYHMPFSFYVRVKFPECPYITPLCPKDRRGPDEGLGLTPWEIWLKKKQAAYFKNFDSLSETERVQQTVMFALMDSEFLNEVNDYSYKNTDYVDGQLGVFDREDQAKTANAIITRLPNRGDRGGNDRGRRLTPFESSYVNFYFSLYHSTSKEVIDRCGGLAVIDQAISRVISFGELDAPYAGKFIQRELLSVEAGPRLLELKQAFERVAAAVKNPEPLFRQQEILESIGRGRW